MVHELMKNLDQELCQKQGVKVRQHVPLFHITFSIFTATFYIMFLTIYKFFSNGRRAQKGMEGQITGICIETLYFVEIKKRCLSRVSSDHKNWVIVCSGFIISPHSPLTLYDKER